MTRLITPRVLRISHFAFLICIASASVAAGEGHIGSNWPEFRGPTGDGHAVDASIPTVIDQSVVRWSTPIHGRGWSSPVVWEDQIWVATASVDGKTMSALCVDRLSGKIIHDLVLIENEDPAFCHPTNSYASCTPAINADYVYFHFGSYLTTCLNRKSADVVWRRTDLECDHFRGPASSPILHAGNLYVALDGVDQQYLVALDAISGKTQWKRDREIEYGTDNPDWMKAYSTAQIVEIDGQPQLVSPSASATIAYDPSNGETLWTVYHGGMNASARPILKDDRLYLVNGMGEIYAVDPRGRGDLTDSNVIWNDRKGVSKKASPVIVDDLLLINSDDGIVSARQCADGKILWKKRLGDTYAASPVFADGLVYFFSCDGQISVIRPGRKLELVAQSTLGDGFMASPAVVGNEIILRSKSKLYCVATSAGDGADSNR